jgi:flagellar protein FlaC
MFDALKKSRKKEDIGEKEASDSTAVQKETSAASAKSEIAEGSKSIDFQTLERINAIENKLAKLDISISMLKRENDELKNQMAKVDANMVEMLSLYEVVANQVNPFVGLSKATSAKIEKLEKMQEEFNRVYEKVPELVKDLELVITRDVDIFKIIEEVTQGA